jgi:Uma2 family endonuclease
MTPQPALERPVTNLYGIISQLSDGACVTFPNVSWGEYEELLDQFIEPAGLRMGYYKGELTAMSLSAEHENNARFIDQLITALKLRLRINIRSFGSWTMKKSKNQAGKEPDACFYVNTAAAIGNRINLDFATDPPPDIAVEVDIHHKTKNQLELYAALGIPELWVFDSGRLTIHLLEDDHYVEAETSKALPMLTASVLTDFLNRLPKDGEFQTLLAFDEWLRSIKQ